MVVLLLLELLDLNFNNYYPNFKQSFTSLGIDLV